MSHTEKMILRVLNWRKAQGVNDIKSSDLTEKVKKAGSLFLRNRDVDGNRLMVSDVKKHIKVIFIIFFRKMEIPTKLSFYFLNSLNKMIFFREIFIFIERCRIARPAKVVHLLP